MKRNKILALVLVLVVTLFAFACGKDPGPKPGPGPSTDFVWEGKTVEDLYVSEDQLNKEYDISEWPTLKESFMITVKFAELEEPKDFPITDEHFEIPAKDLEKLTKKNRVRIHITVPCCESDEYTFYIQTADYQGDYDIAVTNAKDNMFVVERDGEYLVVKCKKTTTINGGQLDITFSGLTLSDVVKSLSEGNSDNYVSAQFNDSKLSVFFATKDAIEADTVLCKIKFTGDYRAAGIEFAATSKLAYYDDNLLPVEIEASNVTFYVSLK